jgi:putative oxidoreductase
VTARAALAGLDRRATAVLDALQAPLAFALRAWVGWQFFKAGLLKAADWQATLFLFTEEYHVPLLPPPAAALAGTLGELAFPLLLWAGLATRFAALGLSAVNGMAVLAYAHVLLAEGFEAALAQHVLWGLMLAVIAVYGPGRWSVDALLAAASTRRSAA